MAVRIVAEKAAESPELSCGMSRIERGVQGLAYAYLFAVSGLTCLVWAAGDRWWVATVLLFGPRWPILLPLLALIPLALMFCRQVLPWLAGAGALAIWLFMGWVVPWQRVTGVFAPPPDLTLRVITYNCGETDTDQVVRMIERLRPDVLTLNEWHPSRVLPKSVTEGMHVGQLGGNLILSRFPIKAVQPLESEHLKPWEYRALRCVLETHLGPMQVVCVHLETPRHGLNEVRHAPWLAADAMRRNMERRRFDSQAASRFAAEFAGPSIVAGDFNMPVESHFYQQDWSGWQNAFSQGGWGLGHTKLLRVYGVRIDHILLSPHWRVTSARVGPDLGGDHLPVVADLALRL